MSKKSKTKQQRLESLEERIYRVLTTLKHKDLQRECILRGLEPKFIVEWDHNKLVSWFYKNFENTQDQNKLIEFDVWRDDKLHQEGYLKEGELVAPALRFAFVGNIATMDKPHDIKPSKADKVPKNIKKPKIAVNEETGVREGTKKAMTYKLAYQQPELPMEEIIEKVILAFPLAEAKSIKIWTKKARKLKAEKV